MAGLTGALVVAGAARTRAAAERLVWGFDDGFRPHGCHCGECDSICHHYRIECVPERQAGCGCGCCR